MDRYQVVLAYDGTLLAGFETQRNQRTVQGEVETALLALGWNGRRILAGGRTDAGVHANGQVIAFDLEWRHGTERLQAAINAYLPQDIAARHISRAGRDFHPRYDAKRRRYRYSIYLAKWPDPMLERFALRLWPAPDFDAMNRCGRELLGRHDFRAFGTAPRKGGSTRRTVFRAEWEQLNSDRFTFWIEADAFLYRMVRRITGTMLQVGNGRRAQEIFLGLMSNPQEGVSGPAAPAKGLCLDGIDYPEKPAHGSPAGCPEDRSVMLTAAGQQE